MMKTDIYIELEFESSHLLEVKAMADYEFVNDGIGTYEFWGEKGNDIRMVNLLNDYEVFDAKGNNITSKLSKHHIKVIENEIDTVLECMDNDSDCMH